MNYVSDVFLLVLSLTVRCSQFPKICREEVSIHVIQSREHILNTVRLAFFFPTFNIQNYHSIRKQYLNMWR